MDALANKSDNGLLDPRVEYNSAQMQNLSVTPDLYRKYSLAMDQNHYEDSLRLARQIDAEIITNYQRSFAATFFSLKPKFTPYTAIYTAEERLKKCDYIGAYNLYCECISFTNAPKSFTEWDYANPFVSFDPTWQFILGQLNKIRFILDAQIQDHFKSLELLKLNPSTDNINKMRETLLQIAQIVPFSNDLDLRNQYHAWQDEVTAIIRAQTLEGNNNKTETTNETDAADMLPKPKNLFFSANVNPSEQFNQIEYDQLVELTLNFENRRSSKLDQPCTNLCSMIMLR